MGGEGALQRNSLGHGPPRGRLAGLRRPGAGGYVARVVSGPRGAPTATPRRYLSGPGPPRAVYKLHNNRGTETFEILRWVLWREDLLNYTHGGLPVTVAWRSWSRVGRRVFFRHLDPSVNPGRHPTSRPRLWWSLYAGHDYHNGFYTTFRVCSCVRHRAGPAIADAVFTWWSLVKSLVVCHGHLRVLRGAASAHRVPSPGDCFWEQTQRGAVRLHRDTLLAMVALWARQIKLRGLYVRRLKRFHLEELAYDDAGVSMFRPGCSGVLVDFPGHPEWGPLVVLPQFGIELYGAALRPCAVEYASDCSQGGMPVVMGEVLAPETPADKHIIDYPFDPAGAAANWRAVFVKTGARIAVPLCWSRSIVWVVHDHVPPWRAGEDPATMLERLQVRHRRPPGCGPWGEGSAERFSCDERRNRYFIDGRASGRLTRLSTWHAPAQRAQAPQAPGPRGASTPRAGASGRGQSACRSRLPADAGCDVVYTTATHRGGHVTGCVVDTLNTHRQSHMHVVGSVSHVHVEGPLSHAREGLGLRPPPRSLLAAVGGASARLTTISMEVAHLRRRIVCPETPSVAFHLTRRANPHC